MDLSELTQAPSDTQGAKAIAAREEVYLEIERQLEMGADDLPAHTHHSHSCSLLEICPDHLNGNGMPTDRKQYWLNAVEAARAELNTQNTPTNEEENSSPPQAASTSSTTSTTTTVSNNAIVYSSQHRESSSQSA